MNDTQLATQITTQVLNQYLECITIKKTQTSKTERIYSSSKVTVKRIRMQVLIKAQQRAWAEKQIFQSLEYFHENMPRFNP